MHLAIAAAFVHFQVSANHAKMSVQEMFGGIMFSIDVAKGKR